MLISVVITIDTEKTESAKPLRTPFSFNVSYKSVMSLESGHVMECYAPHWIHSFILCQKVGSA